MSLYSKYILPKITDKMCSSKPVMKQREKIIPYAHGRVLEIGIGSGLNLDYYNSDAVENLIGLDPSEEMWQLARKKAIANNIVVEFLKAYADQIPLDTNSIDSVVITYTLCSIPDLPSSLNEIARILKPDGDLIFCEHGLAPEKSIQKWQRLINPLWKKLGGGCNLNRNIPEILNENGYQIHNLESMYIPGPKIASYNYWGLAKMT